MTEPPKPLLPKETPEILKPEALKVEAKPKKTTSPIAQLYKRMDMVEAKLAAQPEKLVQSPISSSPNASTIEPQAPNPTHDHKHEDCPTCNKSIGEHFVRKTEPYCPECHEKNPNFKSLAVCADCGLSLGSKEEAEKLEGCPNCGGKKAKEFKYK